MSSITVKAQSADPYVSSSLAHIASKIHSLHLRPNPEIHLLLNHANGITFQTNLSGLTKKKNPEVGFQKMVSSQTKWLESTTDSIFVLSPESRLSVNQFFYAYNDWGDTTRILYKSYDTDANMLENSLLDGYDYDEKHNLVHHIMQSWNKTNMSWDNAEQGFYYYNTASLDTEYYSQYWLENQWVYLDKSTTNYDNLNRKTEKVTRLWYFLVWVTLGKISYQYSEENLLPTIELRQSRDGTHHEWINENRDVYKNSNNHIDTDTYQVWKNNQWIDSTKIIYGYDSNNRPIQVIKQLNKEGTWIDTTKSITPITLHQIVLIMQPLLNNNGMGANG